MLICVIIANIEDKSSTTASLQSEIDGYVTELRNETAKMRDSRTRDNMEYKFLRNYSSWFDNFSDLGMTNIEMPGQYDGFAPPNPDRHVKIFEFDSKNVR